MSRRLPLAVGVILTVTTSIAAARVDPGFFASVSIGSSESSFRPSPVVLVDDREQSFDVGFGYAFGPYYAIQAAYHDFGGVTGFVVCPPGGCILEPGEGECPPGPGIVCFAFVQPVPVPVDVSGWSARVTGSFPFGARFAAFVSLGVIGWDTSADEIVTLPGIGPVDDLDDSGGDLIYAAGLAWHLSDRWSLQTSYEKAELDIESAKIGATFRF